MIRVRCTEKCFSKNKFPIEGLYFNRIQNQENHHVSDEVKIF